MKDVVFLDEQNLEYKKRRFFKRVIVSGTSRLLVKMGIVPNTKAGDNVVIGLTIIFFLAAALISLYTYLRVTGVIETAPEFTPPAQVNG